MGEPGYDGDPLRCVTLKDLPGGKAGRTLEVVRRVTRWENYRDAGYIDAAQFDAIETLEKDWHAAEFIAYSCAGTVIGGTPWAPRPSDTKLDAMARYGAAMTAVRAAADYPTASVLFYAVVAGQSFEGMAYGRKMDRHAVAKLFRKAVEALAKHYGYA